MKEQENLIKDRSPLEATTPMRQQRSLNILVIGDLVVDFCISIDTSRRRIATALRTEFDRLPRDWQFGTPVVSGFAAQAARAARQAGANISLSSVIPRPTPQLLVCFFDEVAADTKLMTVHRGQLSAQLIFTFRDGQLVIPRQGVQSFANTRIPASLDEFRAVVLDAGGKSQRASVLSSLAKACQGSAELPAIGVQGNCDWDALDLEMIDNPRCSLFIDQREALHIARLLTGATLPSRPIVAARTIKRKLKRARLVVMLDNSRVMFLEGRNPPVLLRTIAFDEAADRVRLLALTTIELAKGESTRQSLESAFAPAR